MPQSRKRHGHEYRKPAEVPASQRSTGHFLWAILLGAFAGLIAFSAAGVNYIAIVTATLAGAWLGWIIGRNMETKE
jgi:membrane associated rhomboid family serine protease